MAEETNLDNIMSSLEQQLIGDELVDVFDLSDSTDDDEPQIILTSRCEL